MVIRLLIEAPSRILLPFYADRWQTTSWVALRMCGFSCFYRNGYWDHVCWIYPDSI